MFNWCQHETLLPLIHHPEFLFVLPLGPRVGCCLGLGSWLRLRLRPVFRSAERSTSCVLGGGDRDRVDKLPVRQVDRAPTYGPKFEQHTHIHSACLHVAHVCFVRCWRVCENPHKQFVSDMATGHLATTKGDGALQYTTGLRQNNGRRSEEGDINTLGASGRA